MGKRGREIWIVIGVSLIMTLLAGVGTLKRADKRLQDALFQRPSGTSEDIVIIGIDDKALEELGPYNTWERGVMASALEALAVDPANRPAVVAIDTLYAGESNSEADARLAAAAEQLDVITASMAELGHDYRYTESPGLSARSWAVQKYEEPYPALCQATTQGHINAQYDWDGVMRHGIFYIDVPTADGDTRRVYSMACETVRRFTGEIPAPVTDGRGMFYVPFVGRPGDFYDGISLADLIAGRVASDRLAGKIVLIGPYAVGLQDAYFTPVDRSRQMYGVEYQANVIQSFLEGNYKREAQEWPQLLALLLACCALSLLYLRLRPGWAAIVAACAVALALGGSWLLYQLGWVTHPLWLPTAALLLYVAALIRHYVRAVLARQQITRTFERYVGPEILREILKEGTDNLNLGGTLREIAVLFVDIRGFTSMSERLPPETVVTLLNRYLTMTSGCVARHGGTLDKFIGDATMAFWGAPLPAEDPVACAVRTALDIIAEADALSEAMARETGECLGVGVGVHYGPAVVGNMGSQRRMDYTAIGDTVNTAARLEANAPAGKIYVSRAVADALGSRARTKSLGGTVKLKGKMEGFEVLVLEGLED